MAMQENQAEKWIACLLGDLDSAEAAAVEAEMKANPEEALEMTNTVEQIRAWSSESVPHVPLKLDDLGIRQTTLASTAEKGSQRSSYWLRSSLLVAASIMILALTQVQFSLSFGDSTFSWGPDKLKDTTEAPAQAELKATASNLTSRIEVLEQAASETSRTVEALALQDSMLAEWFNQNTQELAHYQRVESQARLRDMKRMMTWTDYPEATDVKLASGIDSPTNLQ